MDFVQKWIAHDAAKHRAPETEYRSWISLLEVQRDIACPDGQLHKVHPARRCPPGVYGTCMRCGHELKLPF